MRYSLSTGQKARITFLAKEYGHVLKHPEKFHIARVGPATAKTLKASGFRVTPKNVALVPLHDYQSASIKNGQIVFRSGRLTEKTILAGYKDFHKKLKALAAKKLPPNSLVTARIGDNSPFMRSRFSTYADLYKYVFEIFTPKDPDTDKQKLVMQMSVVTIEDLDDGYTDYTETPENRGYSKGKNAKKKAAKKRKQGGRR